MQKDFDDFKKSLERIIYDNRHGLDMMEANEMIEVKQGPYLGEVDKVRFDHVEEHKVIIK